jgi:hypothetical protein
MTDNVVDFDKSTALKRYKAAVDFLRQPLSAASDAAHELPEGDADEITDERLTNLGQISFLANDLCNPKLGLLVAIAQILWADEDHRE